VTYREITDKDVLLPEAGRTAAKHIGALYYETSVLEQFGIETLFVNLSRAALTSKRDRHFWQALGTLKKISRPIVQEPHLSPMPVQPVLKPVVRERADLDYSDLFGEDFRDFGDVVFIVRGVEIFAHKLCLAIASPVFDKLFSEHQNVRAADSGHECDGHTVGITNIAMSVESIDVKCESLEVGPDDANSADSRSDCPADSGQIMTESGFSKRNIFTLIVVGDDNARMFVTVCESVSPTVWRTVMMFCYSGRCQALSVDCQVLEETRRLADALELSDLALSVTNVLNDEEFLNKEIKDRVHEQRLLRLSDLILRRSLYSGIYTYYIYYIDLKFRLKGV